MGSDHRVTAPPPRRLARAERRVEILEQMIEDKTRDMYMLNQDLLHANSDFASTQHLMPGALLVVNADGLIARANLTTAALLGYVSPADFDTWVRPAEMVLPGASLE
jgi:PAS domain-containing protein